MGAGQARSAAGSRDGATTVFTTATAATPIAGGHIRALVEHLMSARKPWTVLAYTVADDKSGGGSLDASAQQELKALCDAADFGRVSIAAQVDFVKPKGVFAARSRRRRPSPAASRWCAPRTTRCGRPSWATSRRSSARC